MDFGKELAAMIKFSHSKYARREVFVQFLGWFEDPEKVYLAMEYIELGGLDRYICESIDEKHAKEISRQLLEGLHYMHSEGYTHRDLKPENIFVASKKPWWVKIGDFGWTKRVLNNETALRSRSGSPHYRAPEISDYLDDDDYNGEYSNAVDIWSFACVLYEIMALQVPFPLPKSPKKYCRGGLFPAEPLKPGQRTSIEGVEFIKSVLQPTPLSRPTASTAMRSLWFDVQTSTEGFMPSPTGSLTFQAPDQSYEPSLLSPVVDVNEESPTLMNVNTYVQPFDTSQLIEWRMPPTMHSGTGSVIPHPIRASLLPENNPTQYNPRIRSDIERWRQAQEEDTSNPYNQFTDRFSPARPRRFPDEVVVIELSPSIPKPRSSKQTKSRPRKKKQETVEECTIM